MGLREISCTFQSMQKAICTGGSQMLKHHLGPYSHKKPLLVFHSDASKIGWSAAHDDFHTGGQWTHTESEAHINHLKLIFWA